jgi:LysM repeat protein
MRNHLHTPFKVLLAVAIVFVGLVPSVAGAAGRGAQIVPSGSLGGLRYHVVVAGDSVGSIARAYGVDLDVLRVVNGLVGDRLYEGSRVLLDPANPSLTRSAGASSSSTSSSSASTGAGTTSTYVVKEGDVMERIARRLGVKLSELLAVNGLKAESVIMPGRTLTVPGADAPSASTSSVGGTYVIKDGDVLERIARRHGIKLSALLAANGLEATSLILPGRTLTVPTASGASSSGASGAATSGTSNGGSSTSSWIGPRMVCPVPGASYMNDWGFPRGSARFHEGTDLFASEGTTIVAPVSGVVTFGSDRLGGTTFSLSSPDGWVIYGAHLASTIGDGGQVAAGTPIATVGSSGNADGGDPHLHMGLKPAGGRPANPYPSLLAACG